MRGQVYLVKDSNETWPASRIQVRCAVTIIAREEVEVQQDRLTFLTLTRECLAVIIRVRCRGTEVDRCVV